ncbi:MAG: hypothetical protein ACC645_01560 [Pirellulales bacterium]
MRAASHRQDVLPCGGGARPALNPFSTRYVRPGAMAYRFSPGQSVDRLLALLRSKGGWGEIIGPHGSGKSTLLETLVLKWQATGGSVVTYRLHDEERHFPRQARNARPKSGGELLVVVDGYEQLGMTSRWWLKRRIRRAGTGLLVTAHQRTGLPHLFDTGTDPSTVVELVENLTTGIPSSVRPSDVIASFARHDGNVREILFDLYLLHERRRRSERRLL